jgi:hypothetical protein
MDKLTKFQNQKITFIETQQVKEGVEADLYSFNEDNSKDLAIVRVRADYKTPMQRILKGEKTVEGHLDGEGTLAVTHPSGNTTINKYPNSDKAGVSLGIDDIMQWSASTDLTFYELCWPPYEDGRFENLS